MIKIEGKKFDWFGLTQILKEHKGKLRQIRMLSVNELKKKYKGAALGPLWALIKPTFTLFILWFAFEIGLKRNGGVHFINGILSSFSCSPAMCRGFIFQNVSLEDRGQ